MDFIITYLKNGKLPEGKIEARVLRLKAAYYILYNDKLYLSRCSDNCLLLHQMGRS